jgi:ComF family protein
VHHLLEQSVKPPYLFTSCVLYSFEKGSPVQTILHELKYKNNREIGLYFGRIIGSEVKRKEPTQIIDALIPVPVHHRKRFDRGYNQSNLLAIGISSVTGLPVLTGLLSKTRNTKSQTKLSKEERRENIIGTFTVSEEIKNYTSVALVDDVVTTGSTVSAICDVLRKKNDNLQIAIFSLSIANNNS